MAVTALREFDHVDDDIGITGGHRFNPPELNWGLQPFSLPNEVPQPLYEVTAPQQPEVLIRESVSYRCALVVLDANDQRCATLDVTFTERVIDEGRSRLFGSDASRSLHITLEAELPPRSLDFNFTFAAQTTAAPADLLPTFEWFEALEEGRRIGLWSLATQHWLAEPVPIPGDHPRLPDGYTAFVKTLVRVQRQTQQVFSMPPEITDEDVANIRRADMLLRGRVITGRWKHATLGMDQESLSILREVSAPHGGLLEFTTDYALDIGGNNVRLGAVRYRFLQIHLGHVAAGISSDEVDAELVPGDNDRFEARLIGPASPDAATLEKYAGRWVAQDGEEVLEVGSTAQEVIAALTRTGRSGSLWRVPASRAEAEAVISILR